MNEKIIFEEKQRFTQIWLWALVLFIAGLSWWFFIGQIIFGVPQGNNPAPDYLVIIIFVVFGILYPLFFIFCHLHVYIDDKYLKLRYFPLHLSYRSIELDKIINYQNIKYNPIIDCGGWGIKYGKYGITYNVKGNKAIFLVLKSGKKILIGSQKADQFYSCLSGKK
ncbi:MAG: hypothetical protein APR63_13935 [Desulfuromonas sp. SDB]|nr:MAG: hypothetical protein APR63_13935 [Desulfuromonas sp. SDB]